MNEGMPLPDFRRSAVLHLEDATSKGLRGAPLIRFLANVGLPSRAPEGQIAARGCGKVTRRANQFSFTEIVVKPLNKKYFALSEGQIRAISTAIPSRPEGRIMIVTTWDGDAVDAEAATDERG